MRSALVLKALLVSAVLIIATAGPAAAGSRSIRDSHGDAAPRWDMTQVKLTNSAHIAGRAEVGGFMYDVDTGALTQIY